MKKQKNTKNFCLRITASFLFLTLLVLSAFFFIYTPDDYAYVFDGLDMANHYQLVSLISKDAGNIAFWDNYPTFLHLAAAILAKATGLPVGLSINLLGLAFFVLFPFSVYKLSLFFSKDKSFSLLAAFFSATIFVYIDLQGTLIGVPHRAAMALAVLIPYLFLSKRFAFAGLLFGVFFVAHLSWPVALALVLLAAALGFAKTKKLPLAGMARFFAAALVVAFPFSFFYNANAALHASKSFFLFSPLPYSFLGLWISPLMLPFFFAPLWVVALALAGFARSAKTKEIFKKHFFSALWALVVFLGTQAYFVFSEFEKSGISFMPGRLKAFLIFPIAFFASFGTILIAKKTKKEPMVIFLVCLSTVLFSVPAFISGTEAVILHSETQKEFIETVSQKFNDEAIFSAPWLDRQTATINDNIIKKSLNSTASKEDKYLFFSTGKTFSPFKKIFVLANNEDGRMKAFLDKNRQNFTLAFSNSDFALFEYRLRPSNDYFLKDAATAFAPALNNANIFSQQLLLLEPFVLKFSAGNDSACMRFFKEAQAIECASEPIDFELEGDKNTVAGLLSSSSIDVFTYLALWHIDHGKLSIKPVRGRIFMEKKIVFLEKNRLGLPKKTVQLFLKDIGITLQIESRESSVFVEAAPGKKPGTVDLTTVFFAKAIKWINPLSGEYTAANIVFGLPFALLFAR